MTATLTAPANGTGAIVAPASGIAKRPLWGLVKNRLGQMEPFRIPIIVGTGEYSSGKTMFGLLICPGPETLVYDNEGSSLTFQSLGFEHIDMASELRKKHGEGFTPQQRYLWWKEHAIQMGKTGKYRVLVIDPASELEDGLSDYIKTHCSEFGLTADQVTKSAGLFWAAMKNEWKKVLDLLRTYYDVVYLTVHLRLKYVGKVPDPKGEKEPKGKETLCELASLFLWFERDPNIEIPAANVKKERLAFFDYSDPDEPRPVRIVPPRLPKATPAQIRKYIANPPDYNKLKKDEKVIEREMSEDEKLRLQAQISASNAEAETAATSRLAMMQQNAAQQAARAAAITAAIPAQGQRPLISEHQIGQVLKLVAELWEGGHNNPQAVEFLTARVQAAGVNRIPEMSDAQGDGLLSDLLALKGQKQQPALEAKAAELMATSHVGSTPPPAAEPPFVPSAEQSQQSPQLQSTAEVPATPAGQVVGDAQKAEFDRLLPLAFPNEATRMSQAPGLILKHGAPRAGLLTFAQFEALLAEMQAMADANSAPRVSGSTMSRLKDVVEKTGWSRDKQVEWLSRHGYKMFSEASEQQIVDLIEEKQNETAGFEGNGGPPGN